MTDNPLLPDLAYERQVAALVEPVQKFLRNRELIEESQRGETDTNQTGVEVVGNPDRVGVVP